MTDGIYNGMFYISIFTLMLTQIYILIIHNSRYVVAVNAIMITMLSIAWFIRPKCKEPYNDELVAGTVWANPQYENAGLGWVL